MSDGQVTWMFEGEAKHIAETFREEGVVSLLLKGNPFLFLEEPNKDLCTFYYLLILPELVYSTWTGEIASDSFLDHFIDVCTVVVGRPFSILRVQADITLPIELAVYRLQPNEDDFDIEAAVGKYIDSVWQKQ